MTTDISAAPELAKAKTKSLSMKSVKLDDRLQPRARISSDAIGRYKSRLMGVRETGEIAFPPVLVAKIPEMGLVIVDGYHRYQAHSELGLDRIFAKVVECSFERACWLAALANMTHGLPLTRQDHEEVFRRYVKAGENRKPDGSLQSYRELQIGLGHIRRHTTLRRWMQKWFPEIYAEMAKTDTDQAEDSTKDLQHSFEVKEIEGYARGISRMTKRSTQQHGERDWHGIASQMQWLMGEVGEALGMTPEEVLAYEEEPGEFCV